MKLGDLSVFTLCLWDKPLLKGLITKAQSEDTEYTMEKTP